jgi:hypothetical protein
MVISFLCVFQSQCLTEHGSEQFDKMSNDTNLSCGNGELELDGNMICKSLDKFGTALKNFKECRDKNETCLIDAVSYVDKKCISWYWISNLKDPETGSLIGQGLQEFESIYTATPDAFDNENGRYVFCLIYALGLIGADNNNPAHDLANCVFNNLNDSLVPVPDFLEGELVGPDYLEDTPESTDNVKEESVSEGAWFNVNLP